MGTAVCLHQMTPAVCYRKTPAACHHENPVLHMHACGACTDTLFWRAADVEWAERDAEVTPDQSAAATRRALDSAAPAPAAADWRVARARLLEVYRCCRHATPLQYSAQPFFSSLYAGAQGWALLFCVCVCIPAT